jgi:transposase-like protein
MVRPGRDRLKGRVEVDETYLQLSDRERPKSKRRGQSNATKALVAVAVEVLEPKGFGRIRLQRIRAASEPNVVPFVCEAVEPSAHVHTDGSAAYRSLPDEGYQHTATVMFRARKPAHVTLPGVHRVASLLKRWLLGTHHGAVQPGQLDYYLDEFVFRFNRRTSRSRGLLFYRLLQQAVATGPVTYQHIAGRR